MWDLSDNGKIIYDENFKYESFIYSFLLFFEENSIIYPVISTLASGETWVVKINEKEKIEQKPEELKKAEDNTNNNGIMEKTKEIITEEKKEEPKIQKI